MNSVLLKYRQGILLKKIIENKCLSDLKCDGKREKNEFFFESGKRQIQTQINDVKACRTLRPTPLSLLNDACLHNDVFANQTLVGGANVHSLCQKGRLFARNVNIHSIKTILVVLVLKNSQNTKIQSSNI